ncbi:hypothetical protein [Streptomyces profundus]|uniref:hypothetical protein n=1 Tax=Streptomyces profundus TaxID=2867410 RepID=UPI001D16A2F9|nr:hypothetical protein [Streptomyces sp. MA3_2.13]UED86426.1 hypothetical protein K4G22_21365 [Streptomyces sp. MA3_2.13]
MNRFLRALWTAVVVLGVGLVIGGMVAQLGGGTGVDHRPALVGMALVAVWIVVRVVARPARDVPEAGGPGRAGVVGYVLVLVLGVTVAVYPAREAIGDRVQAIGDNEPSFDMREPEALEAALAAFSERAGHRQVVEVTLNRSMVWARMPIEPGELLVRVWGYQDGDLTEAGRGNDAIHPTSADEQFSLDEVAWDQILPAWNRARAEFVAETGEEPTGAIEIYVRRTRGDEPRTGPVQVHFSFPGAARWRYSMNADGSGLTREQR